MHTSQHVSTRIGTFTTTDNFSPIKSLVLLDSKWTSGIFCPPRGKLPWQRRRTAKRERSDCVSGGKTDIFFCFFPFCSSSVTMGSSIVPVANATTWYSEKKRKKKEVRRIHGTRVLQNALDAFTSWLIHSFLTVSISFIWLWNSSKSRNQKSSRKEGDSTWKNKFRTCNYVSYEISFLRKLNWNIFLRNHCFATLRFALFVFSVWWNVSKVLTHM